MSAWIIYYALLLVWPGLMITMATLTFLLWYFVSYGGCYCFICFSENERQIANWPPEFVENNCTLQAVFLNFNLSHSACLGEDSFLEQLLTVRH